MADRTRRRTSRNNQRTGDVARLMGALKRKKLKKVKRAQRRALARAIAQADRRRKSGEARNGGDPG